MTKYYKYSILICLFFFYKNTIVYSQKKNVDSLENVLKLSKNDSNKVKVLCKLGNQYLNMNVDKALSYGFTGINLSKKIGFIKGEGSSMILVGFAYKNKAQHDSALAIFFKAQKLFETIKNDKELAKCLTGIALVNGNQGKPQEAMKYLTKALEISRAIKDSASIPRTLSSMGKIHTLQGNQSKALNCFIEAAKSAEELNDKETYSTAVMNMAVIYSNQKQNAKGLEYFKKAYKLKVELGDNRAISACLLNIGTIYSRMDSLQYALQYFKQCEMIAERLDYKAVIITAKVNRGVLYEKLADFTKALLLYKEAMVIAESIDDVNSVALCLNNSGRVYMSLKDFSKAKPSYEKALELTIRTKNLDFQKEVYQSLKELHFLMGNYKLAYEYQSEFYKLNEELTGKEVSKQLAELGTKYETDKKEKEIELLNKNKILQQAEIDKQKAEGEKKNLQQIALLIGFILVSIFAVIIFRSFKQKQKTNLLLSEQKKLVEEKQKEILDSIRYAKRIQKASLPNEKYIDRNIKRLKENTKE